MPAPEPVPEGPPDAPPAEAAGPLCASCGTALVGDSCHRCGERRPDRHDYAFGHWAEHTVDAFPHFDLKVPRGLWSLLRRPGQMTADVLAGRRVRWPKPFQAFIIANVLFYAVSSPLGLRVFETPFEFHTQTPYGDAAQAGAGAKATVLGLSMDAYAERFDALAHTLSKTLVVFFVPVFAALFWALHPRRRGFRHRARDGRRPPYGARPAPLPALRPLFVVTNALV